MSVWGSCSNRVSGSISCKKIVSWPVICMSTVADRFQSYVLQLIGVHLLKYHEDILEHLKVSICAATIFLITLSV